MPRHEDKSQELRALLLVVGTCIGLAGMLTGASWLVYLGLGVLAIGGGLAIVRRWKIRQSERNESTLEE